jgi:hypothetical protein
VNDFASTTAAKVAIATICSVEMRRAIVLP